MTHTPGTHASAHTPTHSSGQPQTAAQTQNPSEKPVKRQFINFQLYRVDPAWRRLDAATRERGKQEFEKVWQEYSAKVILLSYSVLGVRADSEIMFWRISYQLEDFQAMSAALLKTGFGQYLIPSYSYLSMSKRSTYIDKLDPSHQESRAIVRPGKYKYIFVYPFVKTRDWYLLPLEIRQAMMDEHIRIGSKYMSVKLNTTYSFGLDDQDFVVAFESDEPQDFLDLVMELRESQASKYTLRDTPTFTCIQREIKSLLLDY